MRHSSLPLKNCLRLSKQTRPPLPVESQEILKSAVGFNRDIIKPIEGITYTKLMTRGINQSRQAVSYLKQYNQNINKLILSLNGYMEELDFRQGNSSKFEYAMSMIANFIGFKGQRPEVEFGKGPDVLWEVGELKYFIIECKNGSTVNSISKDDCNQLGGSVRWFEEKYGNDCRGVPILVHPVNIFERASTPHSDTRVITEEKLSLLRNALRAFAKAVASSGMVDDPESIEILLDKFGLTSTKFIKTFTTGYKVKP